MDDSILTEFSVPASSVRRSGGRANVDTYTHRKGICEVPDHVRVACSTRGMIIGAVRLVEQIERVHGSVRRVHRHLCADAFYGNLAAVAVREGRVWTADTHPIVPIPAQYPAAKVHDWRMGGCSQHTREYIATDSRLQHWVGWVLLPGGDYAPDRGDTILAWAHEWAVTSEGMLVDPAGTCGVPRGWAYIGVPWSREESANTEFAALWAT